MLVEAMVGKPLPKDGYIDHQSVYLIPRSWDGTFVDLEFFKELKAYFLQDGLVILGGNDNVDDKDKEGHPLSGHGQRANLEIPRDVAGYRDCYVARKDEKTGFWVVFNRSTGGKIRFDFNGSNEAPKKSTLPELVDIKLTSVCPYGCPHCYQDAHPSGEHASNRDWYSVIDALADLRVFEVALGGGEPTLHPDFLKIIDHCNYRHVVPNFTTRNIAWIHDPILRPKIINGIGAFAYSISDYSDVSNLAHAMLAYGIPMEKASVQIIDGVTQNCYQIFSDAYEFGLRVTVLGYKESGRGGEYAKTSEFKSRKGDWIGTVKHILGQKDSHMPTLGIDTVLAKEYKKDLEALKVPGYMYSVVEGKFSMYIDLVDKKMGPSSFCPKEQMVPLIPYGEQVYADVIQKAIRKAFAKF